MAIFTVDHTKPKVMSPSQYDKHLAVRLNTSAFICASTKDETRWFGSDPRVEFYEFQRMGGEGDYMVYEWETKEFLDGVFDEEEFIKQCLKHSIRSERARYFPHRHRFDGIPAMEHIERIQTRLLGIFKSPAQQTLVMNIVEDVKLFKPWTNIMW